MDIYATARRTAWSPAGSGFHFNDPVGTLREGGSTDDFSIHWTAFPNVSRYRVLFSAEPRCSATPTIANEEITGLSTGFAVGPGTVQPESSGIRYFCVYAIIAPGVEYGATNNPLPVSVSR